MFDPDENAEDKMSDALDCAEIGCLGLMLLVIALIAWAVLG